MGETNKKRGRPPGFSPKKNGEKKYFNIQKINDLNIQTLVEEKEEKRIEEVKDVREFEEVKDVREFKEIKKVNENKPSELIVKPNIPYVYEKIESDNPKIVSCLKNKIIKVKFINRNSGFVTDPKHVNFGGMNEKAKRRYTIHVQRNGQLVNPLTDAEKDFLEEFMQMEKNSLSIYKKENNFWKNKMVELVKSDNYLDLSNPHDYIKYKILLTNRDYICPSEEILRKYPKHTYQFVITSDENELSTSIEDLTGKAKAYKLFANMEQDFEKLAYLCEKVAGKVIHVQNKDMILDAVNKMILITTNKFIEEAMNPYLDTEILLKKAVDKGIVRKIRTEYILLSHNLTLCPMGLNPTLKTACEFLNQPRNQEYLFEIEANVN